MPYRNLPVVRHHLTNRPLANAVRPINRSEIIRRIFRTHGDITNNEVRSYMGREGLSCSTSLIQGQRQRMFGDACDAA